MYRINITRGTQVLSVTRVDRKIELISSGKRGLPGANKVESVNGKQGVIVLSPADINTLSTSDIHSYVDTSSSLKVDKIDGKQLSTNDYTTPEKQKLSTIEDQATKNDTDSNLRDRTTHTGQQPISTVTDLQATLNNKADLVDGLIPSSQLPSYVDDVLEANTFTALPAIGESGKIYVVTDTGMTYRWAGSNYAVISESLALGETSATAYRGDRGKIAFDHANIISGNPHNVTKTDIGLSNVDNTSDANKPVSTAQAAADALALPLAGGTMTGTLISPTVNTNILDSTSTVTAKVNGINKFFYHATGFNPSTNLAYNMGGAVNYWLSTFTQTLNLNSTASMSGTNAGQIDVNGSMTVSGAIRPNGTNGINGSNTGGLVRLSGGLTNDGAVMVLGGSANGAVPSTGVGRIAGTDIWSWNIAGINLTTGTLTLNSTSTGTNFYNTTDQVTNYERIRQYWSGNIFNIANEAGGTGVSRAIRIGIYSGGFYASNSSTLSQGFLRADQGSITPGQSTFSVNGSLSASSSQQNSQVIAPTINQTLTAGYTALLINPTETTTGSGAKLLIDAQVGGVSKFSVDNTGALTATAGTVNGIFNVSTNNFNGINIANSVTTGAANIQYSPTGSQWQSGARGSSATYPNSFYMWNGNYRFVLNSIGLAIGDLGTASAPTHTLTLPATATGIVLYNTSDQTTNYERLLTSFISNVATIQSMAGGTGTVRNLQIGTTSRKFEIADAPSLAGTYRFANGTGVGGVVGTIFSGTWNATSGAQTILAITPTYSQTGAASATDFLINRTQTSVGTGAQLLIDAQVGGVSKFKVDSAGKVTASNIASTYVSSTEPTSPAVGDLWIVL